MRRNTRRHDVGKGNYIPVPLGLVKDMRPRYLGMLLLCVALSVAVAGCLDLPNIKHFCTASRGLKGNDYGVYGDCTFTNYGSAAGSDCAIVRLKDSNGGTVQEQKLCVTVPAKNSLKKEFFMIESSSKKYQWEYN